MHIHAKLEFADRKQATEFAWRLAGRGWVLRSAKESAATEVTVHLGLELMTKLADDLIDISLEFPSPKPPIHQFAPVGIDHPRPNHPSF
jgi:hypothetical protein